MDDKKKDKEEKNEGGEDKTEKKEDIVEDELEQLRIVTTKLEDNYKRAVADYQNLERRTQDEKRELARLSNKELLLKLLPILDTLMLAEKHTKDHNFVLTVQQFLQALEQEGVKRIKTIGEEFNPHEMEAVTTAEGEEGKVIDELRAGYMFYDTVLRPAQVIVGKKK